MRFVQFLFFRHALGYLTNLLIPHAEKGNSCGEVPKNGVIELADGQVVFIHGEHQEIVY